MHITPQGEENLRKEIRIPFLADDNSKWKATLKKTRGEKKIGTFPILNLSSDGAAIYLDGKYDDILDNEKDLLISLKYNHESHLEETNVKNSKNGSTAFIGNYLAHIVSTDKSPQQHTHILRVNFLDNDKVHKNAKQTLKNFLLFNDKCEYIKEYIQSDSFCELVKEKVQYRGEGLPKYLGRVLCFINNFINSDLGMIGYVVEKNKDQCIIVDNTSLIGHRLRDFRKKVFELRKQKLSSLDHLETNFYKNQEAIYSCMAHSLNSDRIYRIHYPNKRNEELNPNDFSKKGGMDEKDLEAARQGKFNRIHKDVMSEITIPIRFCIKEKSGMKNDVFALLNYEIIKPQINELKKESSLNQKILLNALQTIQREVESEITKVEFDSLRTGLNSIAKYERILVGHNAPIRSIVVTPDGGRAISGSADNTLRLWDLKTGACLHIFRGHISTVYSVAISNDGKYALSGSDDNTLRLWNLSTGACIATFRGHDIAIRSVAITKNVNYALSGSVDKTIKLWDLHTGKCLYTFKGHDGHVHAIAITPNDKQVLSGSDDKTLKLWDLELKKYIATLRGHTDFIFSVAITPDGNKALSGSGDRTIKLWDLSSHTCIATFEGHTGRVYSVAISPDGEIAASASQDGTVKLWNLETGLCLKTLEIGKIQTGIDSEDNRPWNVTFSPDGTKLLTGTKEGLIYIWSINQVAMNQMTPFMEGQVRYTNAKVVLVGKSGVGKTSLATIDYFI